MYDTDALRRQLEEAWADFILGENTSRQERANKYKTKKIMLRAHGIAAYYHFEFEDRALSLSHRDTPLAEFKPFELMLVSPGLVGLLGGVAEVMGLVAPSQEVPEPETEAMEEDMFFAQHFTASMSDTLSGIRNKSRWGTS